MTADNRERRGPVSQLNLNNIAKALEGRDEDFGSDKLPKATFLFGPTNERLSALIRGVHPNLPLVSVVHMRIVDGNLKRREEIESAWIQTLDLAKGQVIFANSVGETLTMTKSGQVTFGPVQTAA